MAITLRPYQAEAKEAILQEWAEGRKRTLLVLPTGCHAVGQRLMMADGSFQAVENIQVGDQLMGADGTPRTVLHRTEGEGDYYRVMPVKGDPFVVTGDHKLTLVRTNETRNPRFPSEKHGGELIDVTVEEWLAWSKTRKHLYKLIRCSGIGRFAVQDESRYVIEPYFMGILLGDGGLTGSINITTADPEVAETVYQQAENFHLGVRTVPAGKAVTYFLTRGNRSGEENLLLKEINRLGLSGHSAMDKFVPDMYKYAPIKKRLDIIAGLIDSDGYLTTNGYDYISKSRTLADDLAFMCRSVGLAAYVTWCWKTCQGRIGDYYRVSVSGNCDRIPCRVKRRQAGERQQVKSVLRTGFQITRAGSGPYVGFTVDGDNRYLLDDFTITHNCGKTVVLAKVAEDQVNHGGRVLIMAHRGELLNQAADKVKQVTGIDCAYEKAGSSSLGSWMPITVGSVQSLCQEKRLQQFPPDYFSSLIVDEAHHCLSDSYQRVLEHFSDAYVLGVTATPDRGDMRNLGHFFDSRAYEYTMSQAIREKYLCPVKAQMIPLKLDISTVGVSNGDYNAGEIGTALEPYLRQIAHEIAENYADRKTVVFLPLIHISQSFCDLLNEMGVPAAEVNGNSADRADILRDFEAGRYSVLCNSMLLTEGWDCPAVDCIVILRPTKVRSLYQQMVGRGMRLYPGKTELILLDFLWMTERHDLCRPSSLISKDDKIAARIDKQVMDAPFGVDIMEAEEEAEKDVLQEREQALARQLAEMRNRQRKLVDPLQYAMSIAAEDLANYSPTFAWEMDPPSQKQLQFLEKRGIFPESVENMGKARMLIDRLIRRQDEGLSTPKQIRCLERYGFRQVGTWSFEQAGAMLNRLAANNWRIPFGLNVSAYRP